MEMETKLIRYGTGYALAVPKALVDCKIIEQGKKYKVKVKPQDSVLRMCTTDQQPIFS